jgi:hypothetical protein
VMRKKAAATHAPKNSHKSRASDGTCDRFLGEYEDINGNQWEICCEIQFSDVGKICGKS